MRILLVATLLALCCFSAYGLEDFYNTVNGSAQWDFRNGNMFNWNLAISDYSIGELLIGFDKTFIVLPESLNNLTFDFTLPGMISNVTYPADWMHTAIRLNSTFVALPSTSSNITSNTTSNTTSGIHASLFTGLYKYIRGLQPNTIYTIERFDVVYATNLGLNCGGSSNSNTSSNVTTSNNAGDMTYIKVGASMVEPVVGLEDNLFRFMDIDLGSDAASDGEYVKSLGLIGSAEVDCLASNPDFVIVHKFLGGNLTDNSSSVISPFNVTTNDDGELWLLLGTDSMFEGPIVTWWLAAAVTLTSTGSNEGECTDNGVNNGIIINLNFGNFTGCPSLTLNNDS